VVEIEPVFLRIPTAQELEEFRALKLVAYRKAEPKLLEHRASQIRANERAAAEGRAYRQPVDPLPSLETFNFYPFNFTNLYNVNADKAFVPGRPESIYLLEVVPGDYVLYGLSYAAGPAALSACMCLGTVGFTAAAGQVTDLGHFLADNVDKVSSIDELKPESGFGPSVNGYRSLAGATMRPAPPGLPVPDALRGATVRRAMYRAVGKFVDPLAMAINRLVPIPGVLAYDEGRVIDVASGKEAPDAVTR
jgi:hypothetical protein